MLTTDEMLHALTESNNDLVSSKARDILQGKKTKQEVMKYCGSFLLAVLKGDFEEALSRADRQNELCLKIALNKKELNS